MIIIILLLLLNITFISLFVYYYSKYKSCKNETFTLNKSTLPNKSKTPVYVCDKNNIPPQWPFSDYDYDGINIFSQVLLRASGEPGRGEWSVSISKMGDELLWLAGFLPGTIIEISFNDFVASRQVADENGFIFVTKNIPLPTSFLQYDDMRVNITGQVLKDNLVQNSNTSGIQNMSYDVASLQTDRNSCSDTPDSVWAVYTNIDKEKRKQRASTSIDVMFPSIIFGPKKLEDGKVVQKISKTTQTYTIKGGTLNYKTNT